LRARGRIPRRRPRGEPRPRRPARRGPAGPHRPGQLPARTGHRAGMTMRVLVVGGGLAGLLAARRHLRAGHRVVLLEATGSVGGAIAQSVLPDAGDLALNTGAEAYSNGSGAVDALVAELGLAEQVVAPREGLGSRVVSDAGAHRAPGASLLGIPSQPL